jgi:hypothetical protein
MLIQHGPRGCTEQTTTQRNSNEYMIGKCQHSIHTYTNGALVVRSGFLNEHNTSLMIAANVDLGRLTASVQVPAEGGDLVDRADVHRARARKIGPIQPVNLQRVVRRCWLDGAVTRRQR